MTSDWDCLDLFITSAPNRVSISHWRATHWGTTDWKPVTQKVIKFGPSQTFTWHFASTASNHHHHIRLTPQAWCLQLNCWSKVNMQYFNKVGKFHIPVHMRFIYSWVCRAEEIWGQRADIWVFLSGAKVTAGFCRIFVVSHAESIHS